MVEVSSGLWTRIFKLVFCRKKAGRQLQLKPARLVVAFDLGPGQDGHGMKLQFSLEVCRKPGVISPVMLETGKKIKKGKKH